MQDNRRLRKADTEPDVVAYLLPDQRHLNMLTWSARCALLKKTAH